MRRKNLGFSAVFFGLSIFGLSISAQGALTVTIGHDYVAPNSTATFSIGISDTDSAAADDIEGMTFTLQIANGTGSTPSITGINLLNGTVWTGLVSGGVYTSNGATSQFASDDLITDNGGEYLGEYNSPSGTLATFTVNTAGAALGSYSLLLVGTVDPASDSQFTNGVGNPVAAVFNAGFLTVQTTVPEPMESGLLAAGAVLTLRRRSNSAKLNRKIPVVS